METESFGSIHSKRSGDLGSRSEVSSFENDVQDHKEFYWKSQWQHAMYFLAYTFSWGSIASNRRGEGLTEDQNVPTWFHTIFMYMFFTGPLLYLQIFIGQYTQRGCLVTGAMLPLAYGVGYAMLLNTIISCSLNIYFSSCIMYYTLIAMINYPTPSWMLCFSNSLFNGKKCFSRDDIDACVSCLNGGVEPCFDPDKHVFSASIFKENVIFGSDLDSGNENILAVPNAIQAVHLTLTIIYVLCFAVRSLKDLDGAIRIWNIFAVVAIIIMVAVLLLNNPRLEFLAAMFRLNLKSLISLEAWTLALRSSVERLNIMEAGHFLFGSYMPLTVNCTTRVIYIMTVHLIFVTLCNIQGFIIEDFLACSLNIDTVILQRYSDIEITFAIYPMALGILAAAQLWATLYFLILFTLTVHSVVIQIILIQETLSHEWLNSDYYIYTRIALVVLAGGIALLFTSPNGSALASEIYLRRNVVVLILLCLIYLTLYFYGLQRFTDDIHFLLHSRPSRYLKISWTLGGITSTIILISQVVITVSLRFPKILVSLLIVTFAPVPLGVIYQLMLAIKCKDLTTLMKPSKLWGPQDPDEKAYRKLFNPRFEVRFRRRLNICKHRCLLNSIMLRKMIEKELTLLTNVLLEIEENAEERNLKKEFVTTLRLHREIMTNSLNFDKTSGYFATHLKLHENSKTSLN